MEVNNGSCEDDAEVNGSKALASDMDMDMEDVMAASKDEDIDIDKDIDAEGHGNAGKARVAGEAKRRPANVSSFHHRLPRHVDSLPLPHHISPVSSRQTQRADQERRGKPSWEAQRCKRRTCV
jgi:hypothetical protein